MKTLKVLLVIAFVIFSGFSIDSQADVNGILNKGTKDEVVVPLKIWCVTVPNLVSGLNKCGQAPTGLVQGHQTHGGNLIPEQSTWEITDCSFSYPVLNSVLSGTNTVANGDSYDWTGTMEINVQDKNVTLDIEISGGNGRFEDAEGMCSLTGTIDLITRVINFEGEGYIIFTK